MVYPISAVDITFLLPPFFCHRPWQAPGSLGALHFPRAVGIRSLLPAAGSNDRTRQGVLRWDCRDSQSIHIGIIPWIEEIIGQDYHGINHHTVDNGIIILLVDGLSRDYPIIYSVS